jgi:hypothetical protein
MHVIAMDNFFTSIRLFEDLASRRINAIGTMRLNRMDISIALKDTKAFDRMSQST